MALNGIRNLFNLFGALKVWEDLRNH